MHPFFTVLFTDLVRPGDVRLCLPQEDECEHGHSVEDPHGEAEEVDQALNVAAQNHDLCDHGLKITHEKSCSDEGKMISTYVENEGGGRGQILAVDEG